MKFKPHSFVMKIWCNITQVLEFSLIMKIVYALRILFSIYGTQSWSFLCCWWPCRKWCYAISMSPMRSTKSNMYRSSSVRLTFWQDRIIRVVHEISWHLKCYLKQRAILLGIIPLPLLNWHAPCAFSLVVLNEIKTLVLYDVLLILRFYICIFD